MRSLRQLAALVGMLSAGCRRASPSDIVAPSNAARASAPSLQRVPLAIADSDVAEEHYWPMGITAEGRIIYFASESQQPIFRIVDSTGRRMGAFGRQGDGPGEFRDPLEMQIRGDSLRVFDGQRFAQLRYTADGQYVGERQVLFTDVPVAWIGDSVDHWPPPGLSSPGETPVIQRSRIGEATGRVLFDARDSGFRAALASTPGGKPLVRLSYVATADRIYFADAYRYRIYSYDRSGHPLVSFGRDLPPHFRGPRELASVRASLIRASGPMLGPHGERVPGFDMTARLDTLAREISPYFNRSPLHVDRFGRLWVVGVTNDSTTVDVFADSTFLGRTVLPCYLLRSGFPVVLSGHWLLLECELPEASDRASELQLYRVVERNPPAGDH